MNISIRMDDITPDMDWEKFYFFLNLFREVGITPLLGIVPMNQDDNLRRNDVKASFWEEMRKLQEQGYVLALHGYRHVYQTKSGGMFPLNNFSEFAGRTYAEQREDLQAAKQILENNGIQTDIFMAPAHSYDKNTIKALKDLGFTKITDGFGNKPYIWNGITYYPISFILGKSLKKKRGYTTMVIHANTMTKKDEEYYKNLFATYGKDMISYSNYLQVTAAKRTVIGRFCEYMLAKFKFFLVRMRG